MFREVFLIEHGRTRLGYLCDPVVVSVTARQVMDDLAEAVTGLQNPQKSPSNLDTICIIQSRSDEYVCGRLVSCNYRIGLGTRSAIEKRKDSASLSSVVKENIPNTLNSTKRCPFRFS